MSRSGEYDRALHFVVLDAIARQQDRPSGAGEIAKAIRLPESDVKDILDTLSSNGLVLAEGAPSSFAATQKGKDYLDAKRKELEQWWEILKKLYKGMDDEQLYLFMKSISPWIVWVMLPSGIIDKQYFDKMLKVLKMTMSKLVDYAVFGVDSELDADKK